LVPKRYKEFPKLGTWVDTQRVQFKKLKKMLALRGRTPEDGNQSSYEDVTDDEANHGLENGLEDAASSMVIKPLVGRLTDDRIKRLQELGFVWSLRDDWVKHYDELKGKSLEVKIETDTEAKSCVQRRTSTQTIFMALCTITVFQKNLGHCNVPARYPENRRLGIWVSAQRQQYKIMKQTQDSDRSKRSAPLTQERIELLNTIGFTWTIRSRDSLGESWSQRFEELKEFKAQEGVRPIESHISPTPFLV
jgi:Helicase associated domain